MTRRILRTSLPRGGFSSLMGRAEAQRYNQYWDDLARTRGAYIRPPSQAYRYISSESPFLGNLRSNGRIPARQGYDWYISFDRYDAFTASRSLQLPRINNAQIRIEFSTAQIADDVRIPFGLRGESNSLEPLALTYPWLSRGGGTQAVTNSFIQADRIVNMVTGEILYVGQ